MQEQDLSLQKNKIFLWKAEHQKLFPCISSQRPIFFIEIYINSKWNVRNKKLTTGHESFMKDFLPGKEKQDNWHSPRDATELKCVQNHGKFTLVQDTFTIITSLLLGNWLRYDNIPTKHNTFIPLLPYFISLPGSFSFESNSPKVVIFSSSGACITRMVLPTMLSMQPSLPSKFSRSPSK